ncbi:DUF885 domain-containing protein [Coprococcus ammoniilyticus]|uniref:DUF885 domain-containing protein n=1 Tax=Coprococcus ammoniilyticus TaxID=2981785 RepID=A0ABV1EH06_9FIRM|nr:DUF885 domain-containing protein [Coprococcus ammoniilyticus]MCU6731029.1 DUF885 domain-containing protein [Coprococcus ammoniilyticus]RGH09132.1 DUF885 domain-containing protein [Clostridium sp. AF15-31]SCH90626.1 Bacterial protein of uncharacterised function (DUF885) [uncultured Coprococcus sp.]
MLKKRLLRTCKNVMAAAICISLAVGLSACGETQGERRHLNDKNDTTENTERAQESFSEDALKEQQEFEQYLDDYFKDVVTDDTLTYNYTIRDGADYGLEEPEVTLGDPGMTAEEIGQDKEEFEGWVKKLDAIDRSCLTEDQKLTYDVLDEYFEVSAGIFDNVYLYEPFSPMRGLQANIATNFTDYRFDDKGDVERYIELLGQIPDYFAEYLDFEQEKSEKGYFMSDAVCDKVISQCKDFVADKENHFMVTTFNDNIDALDFLTDEEKAEYKEANKQAVVNSLLPAFENVAAVLSGLKGTGTNDGGICNYDGGKEYYEYLLKNFAGTAKSPEEVIDMLDTELQKLMVSLYQYYLGNQAAYEYFAANYDSIFAETDQMTASEMVDKMMETASEHYPDAGTINYKAEALDKNLETIMDDVLAYYMAPAIDDPDNNLIRVNGLHTDGMWTTLAHEGYPGHMLQNAYYMSTDPEPVRTLMNFLGYKEGWAMYACYDSLYYYEYEEPEYGDTIAALYQLNDEMSYLMMGRVDLGINYEGWTLQDTADYLTKNGMDGSAAQELYTTMVGDPAVYQSYSTGYYEMKELRDYAEEKMGDDFDLKTFNTIILETGPCQFDILKEQVDKKLQGPII